MTDAELVRLGDLNYLEALREQSRSTGGRVHEERGLLLASGIDPYPLHNYAARTDPACDARELHERSRNHFHGLRHGYVIVTMNAHDDSGLARVAASEGAVEISSPPAMFCTSSPAAARVPDGITLTEVEDQSGLHAYRHVSELAWASYGIPEEATAKVFGRLEMVRSAHVRAVVAYDAGRPVSCAMLLLSHGVAGVYWVGTLPDARGRGLAEACTREVTRMGFALGARFVTLQASAMGEPVYRKIGFRSRGGYKLLAWMPTRGG